MKTYIVIAAYKEEKFITKVVKNLHKSGYKNIVVVDDGSGDRTGAIAAKAGAIVLTHVVNRGQGAALQTGIDYAINQGADIIVTFDADGQHQAKDLKRMISYVTSGKYDVALGSRFLKGAGDIPKSRRLLLKGSIIVQRIFYGVNLTDAHNGLRVLSRKAAKKIRITSDRMEHASQIAEEIFRHNLRYKEVPVNILYTEYSQEKGHGSFFGALKVFLQYVMRKIMK
ncbi:glycosyltransferase family 2 protein [Nanoarchaeota archaeon]